MRDKGIHLDKAPFVQESLDALPSGHLPLGVLGVYALLPPAHAAFVPKFLEQVFFAMSIHDAYPQLVLVCCDNYT